MSDVVSRLLAAIDERERKARAAGSLQAMWWQPGGRRNGRNTIREFLSDNDPDSVLRLCQSHRDIVAEWQRNKQMADQLAADPSTAGSDADFTAQGIVAGLGAAVTLVARGYGVEDGEGQRG